MAEKIKLLSAGAVKPALVKAIAQFRDVSDSVVNVSFATGPEIRQRLLAGEAFDVVIAPKDVIDGLARAEKIATANLATLGRIGVGVMTRNEMSVPEISTVASVRQALLNADSIVFNQASTGSYVESLFDRLGIAAQVKSKTKRYADFAAVLDHIRKGQGNEIGFGATTVIIESTDQSVRFVGPLPGEIQNYTTYTAAPAANSSAGAATNKLLSYLASGSAKLLFTGAGIE
jgi:molybdate transport system substrate-binding protein